jgi:hypothetical protein
VYDVELLDDDTLTNGVGLSKLEIRKLRALIKDKGTGPTMMKVKVASNAKGAADKTAEDAKAAAGAGSPAVAVLFKAFPLRPPGMKGPSKMGEDTA